MPVKVWAVPAAANRDPTGVLSTLTSMKHKCPRDHRLNCLYIVTHLSDQNIRK